MNMLHIFPFPKRLDQKWWHRLSKVLILLLSSLALLVGIFATWLAIDSNKINHTIYNFETGFSSDKHEAQMLSHLNATYDFLDRMVKASKDRSPEDREWVPKEGISIDDLREPGVYRKPDWEIRDEMLTYIENGENSDSWKIKTWHEYSYFPEILFLLTGPIVHLVLIGFYGIVLYIIFGKNPFK